MVVTVKFNKTHYVLSDEELSDGDMYVYLSKKKNKLLDYRHLSRLGLIDENGKLIEQVNPPYYVMKVIWLYRKNMSPTYRRSMYTNVYRKKEERVEIDIPWLNDLIEALHADSLPF